MKTYTFTKAALPNGWMGNMCGQWKNTPLKVSFQGIDYHCSENLFQALRFDDISIRRKISKENGLRGKIVSKEYALQRNVEPLSWQDVRNMALCLAIKMEQNPIIVEELLQLDCDCEIIEDVSARIGDAKSTSLFWGSAFICGKFWVGKNVLGKLWGCMRHKLESTPKVDGLSNDDFFLDTITKIVL